jgi:hypothetical protein
LLQGGGGGENGSGLSAATHAGSADSNSSSSSSARGSAERQQLPDVLLQGSGVSCGAPPLASSGALPVQRQTSFEPLQRVVGGFAVSLVAQQSPLVQ